VYAYRDIARIDSLTVPCIRANRPSTTMSTRETRSTVRSEASGFTKRV
jgi:hypothetical protein